MEILNSVFQLSIRGSIIFFIFLILKPGTKKHFNSSWHYKILALILLFFLIPINNFINLPIKPISNIPSLEIKEEIILQDINPNGEIKNIEGNNAMEKQGLYNKTRSNSKNKNSNLIKSDGQNLQKENFNISILKNMITYIWLIGGISLLLIKIVQYIKFKSFISKYGMKVEEDDVLNLFDICMDDLNLNRKIILRTCNSIGSPMLIGVFKPMVLIPSINEDYKRLKMIFLHELNHCKRNDIIIKAFALIINAIHWFNPFIYILLREMDKYCEYSIDEKVVEKMDINDRKYYGQTILSLIGSSMLNKTSFTTSMGSNGRQLKTRLENMIYSFKTTRKKHIISVLTGILIFVSGFTVACSVLPDKIIDENNSFAVYIKEDGLYYSYLEGGEEVKIHDGDSFENPLISKAGNYIAYTKGGSLYIYNIKDKSYDKIDDEIEHSHNWIDDKIDHYYNWINDETIIYGSNKKEGFRILNLVSKQKTEHLDEYYYTELISSKDNIVYATRMNKWTTEEGDFISNEGIVEIDLNNYDNNKFTTNIIVEAKKITEEGVGTNPIIWDISADSRYIYVMEKPASGSLSADGVGGIGIYDVQEKIYTEYTDITTLFYKNHLAINPNNKMIGLIKGVGREMLENKEVVLLDINKDKTYRMINFMDKDLVAMTPSFTLDGKRLLYSATKNISDNISTDFDSVYDQWDNQPHNIYEYNLETLEVKQITDGKHFDFMPVAISNNEILFTRYKGNDYYSLIKLANGKENIIADNLIFRGGIYNYPFEFYGHIETERAVDVFIKKSGGSYTKAQSLNQDNMSNNTTDILEELENKEFFVKGATSNKSNNDLVIEFGQSFVNLFTGAVAKQEKVSLDKYISNENLGKFMDKVLELTQIQDIEGNNHINYGLENEFGTPILREHPKDGLWYLELPFEFEGSGMTAKMLIGEENKALKLVDIYFGTKDGVDTFATGHEVDRDVKDPSIWEDEDWVRDVFDRLDKFEFQVNIPYRMEYHDPYANPPLKIDIQAGKQILTEDEMDIYMKYRRPNISEKMLID